MDPENPIEKLLKLLKTNRTRVTKNSDDGRRSGDEKLVVVETDGKAGGPTLPEYELLAMYGFSLKYPSKGRLELNPKTRREKGDVAFHLEEGFRVFLSWGSLEEARRRFDTAAAQASATIERSVKSTRAKLDSPPITMNVRIQGHDAVHTHARMFVERGGFPFGARRTVQDSHSMHLHCDDSGRYYVVYAFTRPETSEQFEKIFAQMISSLKCHAP